MFGPPKSAKYKWSEKKTFFSLVKVNVNLIWKNLVEPLTIRHASEESRNLPWRAAISFCPSTEIKRELSLVEHGKNYGNNSWLTYYIIAPAGISPQKAKSRGGTLVTRAYIKESTYSWNIQSYSNIEKISICLNWGREESVGNDDVSIVFARKYEMIRTT